MIGALGHTELTARAVLSKIAGGEGTWRSNGCCAFRGYLIFYFCQPAINLQFGLLRECGSGCSQTRANENC